MYPQNILDEIRDRVSIAALIGERIPLKKAGRNFKGACPFHSEKTPSFMVSDEKQIYHCFGCGEGGNVFNFFMKFDGLSFRESVEMLAARAGIKLPTLKPIDIKKEDEITTKKKWAHRLNQIVAEYYVDNINDSKKGLQARNYLKSRDIYFEKNTQHFLGYADDTWDGLVRFLKSKNVPLDLAVEVGLLKKRDDGGYYDFFRHRIMFPVITPIYSKATNSLNGNVVAFSGRTFGEPKTSEGREPPAKYLNSPDSIIYHKSYTVYGLNVAGDAIRKEDQVAIVEGNLDVIRLHQEGIKNVVAPLGTALTSGHLKLLARLTKNFVVIFDGDLAGHKAAERSLPLFVEVGVVPRVVILKDGEDPDSFVKKNGASALKALIDKSGTLFEWIIDDTVARFGKGTDGKVKVVEELKPLFKLLNNPVELALYRKHLAGKLMLEEGAITSYLSGKKATSKKAAPTEAANKTERTLLELMLTYPETVKKVCGMINLESFLDGSSQTIARLIFEEFEKSGKLDVGGLAEKIVDEELKREVLALAMAENKYEEPLEAVNDCIDRMREFTARQRLQELQNKIATAGKDDDRVAEWLAEKQKINRELHNINIEEITHERTGTQS